MDQDDLHMQCSVLNADFSSLSIDTLGWRRPAETPVKDGYPPPLKSGYFRATRYFSVKKVADIDILLIVTSTSDELFNGVNIDDLEWFWTPKIEGPSVYSNFRLWHTFQEWIAPTWLEMDLDNLRTRSAKAVARLMSFAQITCYC